MSGHERFQELLARRAELSPAEERALAAHLSDCPECRQTAQSYARQAAMVRSLPLADPPPLLRARILHDIQERSRHGERRSTHSSGGHSPLAFLSLPAVALLAAAVLLYLHVAPPGRPTSTAARVHPTAASVNLGHSTSLTALPHPSDVAHRRAAAGRAAHGPRTGVAPTSSALKQSKAPLSSYPDLAANQPTALPVPAPTQLPPSGSATVEASPSTTRVLSPQFPNSSAASQPLATIPLPTAPPSPPAATPGRALASASAPMAPRARPTATSIFRLVPVQQPTVVASGGGAPQTAVSLPTSAPIATPTPQVAAASVPQPTVARAAPVGLPPPSPVPVFAPAQTPTIILPLPTPTPVH